METLSITTMPRVSKVLTEKAKSLDSSSPDVTVSYTFVVKSEFAEKCVDYAKQTPKQLLTEYKIAQYLHNPQGPAIINHTTNTVEYFIDGRMLTGEEKTLFESNLQFDEQLEDLIKE